MRNIVVVGANGRIARYVTKTLSQDQEISLRLFLRDASRLHYDDSKRVELIEGDVLNTRLLESSVKGADLVYANLAGNDIVEQARSIVTAMHSSSVGRLVWVSTLGIHNEIPGEFGRFTMDYLSGGYIERYTAAAKIIEESNLDYTIIRPGWLDDYDEVDYEITHRDEPFKGTEVSRKSVADLIVHIIKDPSLYINDSLGVNKPGMDFTRPKWLLS